MENREISADSHELMKQAVMTAGYYLDEAINEIDGHLGVGFAKQHPRLIGAFMQAASCDLAGAIIAKMLEQIAIAVADQ